MRLIDDQGSFSRWEGSFTPLIVGRYEYSFTVKAKGKEFVYEKETFPFEVMVSPELARFGTWYESFPRSFGGFKEAAKDLIRVGKNGMGFNILYIPPIHPVGSTKRKGPNNTMLDPSSVSRYPGSPWAIGNAGIKRSEDVDGDGGHRSIDPDYLGNSDDFISFIKLGFFIFETILFAISGAGLFNFFESSKHGKA